MVVNAVRVVLSALLVGALFCASPASADDAARDKAASRDNLKRIGLAANEYHDDKDDTPCNILSRDGAPLLSWRVALLPFLDQKALFEEFNQDEPWDSDHNKKLIEKMPKVYAPAGVKAKPGETYYQMFEGENTILGPRGKKRKPLTLYTITTLNGISNTGMAFEAGDPVIWSKPADLPFDKNKPLPKLGGLFSDGFYVAFCDGHVQFIEKGVDEENLKCAIMWNNTKPFQLSKPKKKSSYY